MPDFFGHLEAIHERHVHVSEYQALDTNIAGLLQVGQHLGQTVTAVHERDLGYVVLVEVFGLPLEDVLVVLRDQNSVADVFVVAEHQVVDPLICGDDLFGVEGFVVAVFLGVGLGHAD